MEKETARHSKDRTTVASSSRSSPTTVNDIPVQLLKLIFRRLDSHVAYVRAAAVCTRWRRILSTRSVMCYDWNVHDFCTKMGYYHVANHRPSSSPGQGQRQPRRAVVFVPASPTIDARHFTLDFLPTTSCPDGRPQRHWDVVDGCGSLLLVASQRRRGLFVPDLMVCEPISRRYVTVQPLEDMKHRRCLGVFLNKLYCGVTSMSSFSLTCVLCQASVGIADGVSAVTARVYQHQPPGWSRWKRGWSMPGLASSGSIRLWGAGSACYAGRSKGFVFWGIQDDRTGTGIVFAAKEGSSVLSQFRLPDHVWGSSQSHQHLSFRFVDDGPGNDNLVRVISLAGDELKVFLKPEQEHANDGGVNWDDWVHVQSLNLREATRGLQGYKECFFINYTAKIVTAGNGYVVLTPAEETWLFSVELSTMHAEADRGHIRNRLDGEIYPYELRLPPRVRACL